MLTLNFRFTDFIVNEVDQSGIVVHLTVIGNPVATEPLKTAPAGDTERAWQSAFNERLLAFFSESAIESIKKLFAEGPEPPELISTDVSSASTSNPGGERGRGRGRGGRGGRDGGGRGRNRVQDLRQVISEVCRL